VEILGGMMEPWTSSPRLTLPVTPMFASTSSEMSPKPAQVAVFERMGMSLWMLIGICLVGCSSKLPREKPARGRHDMVREEHERG
jgi:hypothetical protein